jgi:hypothetical protein
VKSGIAAQDRADLRAVPCAIRATICHTDCLALLSLSISTDFRIITFGVIAHFSGEVRLSLHDQAKDFSDGSGG